MQFRANETIVDTSSWNKALTFCYDGDPITIEITITNKSLKNPLYVKVTDKTHETIQGLTTRILNNNELQNLASLNAGENSTTFKVKLSPTNETLFSAMYNIGVKMSVDPLQAVDKDDLYQQENAYKVLNYTNSLNTVSNNDFFVNMGRYPQKYHNSKSKDLPPLNSVKTENFIQLVSLSGRGEVEYEKYWIYFDLNTGREFVFVNYFEPSKDTVFKYYNTVGDGELIEVDKTLSDGSEAVIGSYGWFELTPIQWLVLGYYNLNANGSVNVNDYVGRFNEDSSINTTFNPVINNIQLNLVSFNVLATSFIQNSDGAGGSVVYGWETSTIKALLNGNFKQNAFLSSEIEKLESGIDSTAGQLTTDSLIWIESSAEKTNFKSYGPHSYYLGGMTESTCIWAGTALFSDFAKVTGNINQLVTRDNVTFCTRKGNAGSTIEMYSGVRPAIMIKL